MAQMPTLTTPDIGSKYADLGKSIKTGLTEATAAGVKAYDDWTTEKAIYAVLKDYPELDRYYPKDMIIKSKMSPMEVARRAQAMDTASKAYDQKITEMPQGVPPQFPEKAAAMAGIFANPEGLSASISAWDGLVARAKGEQAESTAKEVGAGMLGMGKQSAMPTVSNSPVSAPSVPVTAQSSMKDILSSQNKPVQADTTDAIASGDLTGAIETQKSNMPSIMSQSIPTGTEAKAQPIQANPEQIQPIKAESKAYEIGKRFAKEATDEYGRPTRESFKKALIASGMSLEQADKYITIAQDAFQSEKDIEGMNYKKATLAQKKIRDKAAIQRGMQDQQFKEKLLGITAMTGNLKGQAQRIALEDLAKQEEIKIAGEMDDTVKQERIDRVNALLSMAQDMTPNMETLQDYTSGLIGSLEKKHPDLTKAKRSPVIKEGVTSSGLKFKLVK